MRNMAMKSKEEKAIEEIVQFLKFDLANELALIRGHLGSGKIILADKELEELQKKLYQKFPFRYGSEMDAKGYSDLKVLFGEL
jgi:hypothetical protein